MCLNNNHLSTSGYLKLGFKSFLVFDFCQISPYYQRYSGTSGTGGTLLYKNNNLQKLKGGTPNRTGGTRQITPTTSAMQPKAFYEALNRNNQVQQPRRTLAERRAQVKTALAAIRVVLGRGEQ